jgi:hypothetical protein
MRTGEGLTEGLRRGDKASQLLLVALDTLELGFFQPVLVAHGEASVNRATRMSAQGPGVFRGLVVQGFDETSGVSCYWLTYEGGPHALSRYELINMRMGQVHDP